MDTDQILLSDKVVQLEEKIAELTHQFEERITELTNQLDWFKRQLFGRKSEKLIPETPEQEDIFGALAPAAEDADAGTEVASHKRRNKKQFSGDEVNDTGLRFDASVPTRTIEMEAPELQGADADQYEIIDYKETRRLAQQPGSYTVLIYRRPVVRHKQEQTLSTMAAPEAVLDGCFADVSLIAGMMVDKGVYHLPLYRQHRRIADNGIHISRASPVNWMGKGIALLEPVYQAQLDHILQSQVLAMDEVPIKAGRQSQNKSQSKGQMQQTWFWPLYGDGDEVAFTWSQSRSSQHAEDQLADFKGILLTDGYAAYSKTVALLNQKEQAIVHAACWAHSRRTFEKSLNMEPAAAKEALNIIAGIYRTEKHIREKELTGEKTLACRQKYSEPLVTGFFQWVYTQRQRPELLPSNPLAKALKYVHARQAELRVFLANPDVPVDTNHLERALRVIPMGRKNYLFCWSELGAKQLGILQSLMVTCRLHGVNPYTYLVDVLQRISCHPTNKVEQLTPRLWKQHFADNPLTSDLDIPA